MKKISLGIVIVKLYNWYMKRTMAKQQKTKQDTKTIENREVVKKLKDLYYFVKWINTQGLSSRRTRKNFWRMVEDGQPLVEETLQSLILKYEEKLKEK